MAAPLCIYEEVIPDIKPYNRFIYAYTNEKMLYVQTKLQSRKNPPRLLSGFGEKHECRNTTPRWGAARQWPDIGYESCCQLPLYRLQDAQISLVNRYKV